MISSASGRGNWRAFEPPTDGPTPVTVHLIKLCVGADAVADLAEWVKSRTAANQAAGHGRVHDHVTRMFPRRAPELLDGGSIYWVIGGLVQARQRILALEPVTGIDGIDRCAILLDPNLALTEPQPRRPFQGWRYLRTEDAPADLARGAGGQSSAIKAELAALGLL